MSSVCAVVPTHSRKELLTQSLRALLRQTRPLDEIVVVDNGSTDGTEAKVREEFGSRITYVRLPGNTGSAGGFREGMRLAFERGHDWVWCMDDDAVPQDDALQKLIEAESSSLEPVVAKVCSRRDPVTGMRYRAGEVLDFKRHKNVPIPEADWAGKNIAVDCAPWAGLLVRTEAAHRAGYPNGGLFAWFDDSLFTWELRKLGQVIHVDTTAILHPYETAQREERFQHRRLKAEEFWKQYYLFRNGYLLRQACFGRWYALRKLVYDYARCLASIMVLDGAKIYRIQLTTKAFVDGLLGRLGRRVQPEDFAIKSGRARGAAAAADSKGGSALLPTSDADK